MCKYINFDFNKYILFSGDKFVKNKRQDFLTKITKDFNVKDDYEKYARCHSVSYSSMVSVVIKCFNFILQKKESNNKEDYDNAVNMVIKCLTGLTLAVKKSPLLITDDYKLISVNNYYSGIIESSDVETAFINYAISKNLILKLIFRLLMNPNDVDFKDHLLDYGNILIEKLNNCPMNLRVGVQKYNVVVKEFYDIISYQSCDDGIIIDNEMDCCVLSHLKHLMYPIEESVKELSPKSIILPTIYKGKDGYRIANSFLSGEKKEQLAGEKKDNVNIYFYDWYTKDKKLTIL